MVFDEVVRHRRVTSVEAVVEDLKAMILEGRVAPGTVLPGEVELCQAFGVSRATIREAARVLEHTGLVTRGPTGTRRLTVAPWRRQLGRVLLEDLIRFGHLSPDEIREARSAYEPQLVRWAAERATAEERAELAGLMDRLATAVEDPEFHALHRELHDRIAGAAHNRMARLIFHTIRTAAELAVPESVGEPTAEVVDIHRALTDAILATDPVAAEAAIRRHLALARSPRWRPPDPEPGPAPPPTN